MRDDRSVLNGMVDKTWQALFKRLKLDASGHNRQPTTVAFSPHAETFPGKNQWSREPKHPKQSHARRRVLLRRDQSAGLPDTPAPRPAGSTTPGGAPEPSMASPPLLKAMSRAGFSALSSLEFAPTWFTGHHSVAGGVFLLVLASDDLKLRGAKSGWYFEQTGPTALESWKRVSFSDMDKGRFAIGEKKSTPQGKKQTCASTSEHRQVWISTKPSVSTPTQSQRPDPV